MRSDMSTVCTSLGTGLWRIKARFITRYMPLTSTADDGRYPPSITPSTLYQRSRAFSGRFPDKFSIDRTIRRTLFHSTEGLWSAMFSAMEQVRKQKSSLEEKSSNFDPFVLLFCEAVTRAPLVTIASMTQVEVQDPVP